MRSSLLAACTLALGVTACDKPAQAPPKKEIQVRSAEQKKLFEAAGVRLETVHRVADRCS